MNREINETSFLEMMLHSKKLNYDRLNNIIPDYIPKTGVSYDTVNIIVDIYDVIKQLYKPTMIEEINNMKAKQRYQITSELINIISHYRHYFASRLWKYTNFYFIYSDKKSLYHTNIMTDYRNDFYDKRLNSKNSTFGLLTKLFKDNIKLISNFIEYIPHCYFINSGEIDYTYLPYILMNEGIIDSNNFTILLSNEEVFYQDFAYFDDYIQLLIKGDKSRIVTRENMWDEVLSGLKKKPEINLLPELYPLVLAFKGYKNFNIPSISNMGIGRAVSFTQKLIDKGELKNIEYNSIEFFKETVNNSTSIKEEDKEQVIKNFLLLSHNLSSTIYYIEELKVSLKKSCSIDRIDSKSVKYINEKYFSDFPILLDFCFEGENYA